MIGWCRKDTNSPPQCLQVFARAKLSLQLGRRLSSGMRDEYPLRPATSQRPQDTKMLRWFLFWGGSSLPSYCTRQGITSARTDRMTLATVRLQLCCCPHGILVLTLRQPLASIFENLQHELSFHLVLLRETKRVLSEGQASRRRTKATLYLLFVDLSLIHISEPTRPY